MNGCASKTILGVCCDLTFHAFRALILNLEHLYIIEVLTHANATSMFKRMQMFTLIVMMPLQFDYHRVVPTVGM